MRDREDDTSAPSDRRRDVAGIKGAKTRDLQPTVPVAAKDAGNTYTRGHKTTHFVSYVMHVYTYTVRMSRIQSTSHTRPLTIIPLCLRRTAPPCCVPIYTSQRTKNYLMCI